MSLEIRLNLVEKQKIRVCVGRGGNILVLTITAQVIVPLRPGVCSGCR